MTRTRQKHKLHQKSATKCSSNLLTKLTIEGMNVVLGNHIVNVGFDVRVDVFGITVLEVKNGHCLVGEHFGGRVSLVREFLNSI